MSDFEPTNDFAAYLRMHRVRQELSQSRLAEKAGLDQSAISLLESRRRHPTENTIDLLCDALELTRDEWDVMLDLAGYRPRSIASLMNFPRLGVLDDMYPRLTEDGQRELAEWVNDGIDTYAERLIA